MNRLDNYYHDDDPRNRQPEVPELLKCEMCGFLFEESIMITDDVYENTLFCSEECKIKYWEE